MSILMTQDGMRGHLLQLLQLLKDRGYSFITPTPATHRRVLARPERQQAQTIQDVLGWSLPYVKSVLPADVEACLEMAGLLRMTPRGRVSLVRVSSLDRNLYLHSAYPTDEADAVFFGPDSYRFADAITREFGREPPRRRARIVDIGTGAGVGAITAAALCPNAKLVMTDINASALCLANINVMSAGFEIEAVKTNALEAVHGSFDIALINPPYLMDEGDRAYRDGGGQYGSALAIELVHAALDRLTPGGRIVLYTGSAILQGVDTLRTLLTKLANGLGGNIIYKEVDPDVFGEELCKPQYRDVDRIALVTSVIEKSA